MNKRVVNSGAPTLLVEEGPVVPIAEWLYISSSKSGSLIRPMVEGRQIFSTTYHGSSRYE